MEQAYEEKISILAELIKRKQPCFVLSGAGISTESGIPDFRSPGTGLWTKMDPVKVASRSTFFRNPEAFYDANLPRWRAMEAAEPGDAHHAVAMLEKKGFIVGVITQNVDSLHIRAGSRRVWEIHGHLRTVHCSKCRESHSMEFFMERYQGGERIPRCTPCGGVLRPDVVLFEDPLAQDYYRAEKALTGCQLLIVVGSSLQVYPAAGLLNRSRYVAIINQEPTSQDDIAAVVIRQSAGKVFRDLLMEMGLACQYE